MRVLFFTENYYAGGTDSVIVNLMNYWPAKDEFVLLANDDHPGVRVIEARLKVPCRVVRHNVLTRERIEKQLGTSRWKRKCLRIVFSAGQYFLLIYHFLYFKRLLSKISPDKIMIISGGYPAGSTIRAVALQGLWRSRAQRPLFAYLNDPAYIRRIFTLPEYLLDKLTDYAVRYFVTLSYATQKNMSRRPMINQKGKQKVIYCGIEIPSEPAHGQSIRSELGLGPETPIILMLGNYEARKGHDFLLQVFRIVQACQPQAHLVCAGYGYPADQERVCNLVQSYGLSEAVHLFGFRNDVAQMLRDATILAAPSQHSEAFNLTLIDAMARRVPVVATAVGGMPEVVAEGGGFAVPPNAQIFADKIVELLNNSVLRAKVGEAGHQAVLRRFEVRRMAQEYYELLHHEK